TVSKEIPMWFRALYDSLKVRPGNAARRTSRRRAALRLRLEALEDRTVPSFYAPVGYATHPSPHSPVTADLHRGGPPDPAVASYTSSTISVLAGSGDGCFGPASSYPTGVSPRSLAVGDFNADGKLDLVTANPGSGDVSALLGNGDGTFAPAQNLYTGGSPA